MKLADLDESLTPVPIDDTRKALRGVMVLAVLPAQDQEHETACLLVAGKKKLVVVCRADGPNPHDPPTVALEVVDWHEVGVGPFGLSGRVPGGLLGGAEATDHLLTVVAGDRLFEARVPGSRGPEALTSFASAARRAGARDYEP
jgi:hypothetical protein